MNNKNKIQLETHKIYRGNTKGSSSQNQIENENCCKYKNEYI